MSASRILETQPLSIQAGEPLAGMYQLSPYVWRDGDRFRLALRAVNRSEDASQKVSRVYFGSGSDGREFAMDPEPKIQPTAGPDERGCEDPTVVRNGKMLHILYSGWDGLHSRMLRASGTSVEDLEKCGELFPGQDRFAMAKEAAVLPAAEGARILFEYSTEGASRIGEATGPSLTGPFTLEASKIAPREDHWDSFHLSPGDAVLWRDRRILVYSGADRETKWRIGWAELDDEGRVLARADEPLIAPFDLEGEDTDIAFAASAIVDSGELWIYYSVADRALYRSRVEIGDEGRVAGG